MSNEIEKPFPLNGRILDSIPEIPVKVDIRLCKWYQDRFRTLLAECQRRTPWCARKQAFRKLEVEIRGYPLAAIFQILDACELVT